MKYRILIFIITYNASFRVIDVIKKMPFDYLKKHKLRFFISDDNSNDNTIKYLRIAKKILKKKIDIKYNHKNVGYGANIKRCIKFAIQNKFDYAVMVHGDNQYNPKYIPKMIKLLLKKNNISAVTGSRMINKNDALKGKMPIYKFIGNIFLTSFFNNIFGTKFTDCHSGYWAYNLKKIKKEIFLKADNKFCFDLDVRLQLTKKKQNINEIPIRTFYGTERSSMHLIYALRFFYKIIKFRILSIL